MSYFSLVHVQPFAAFTREQRLDWRRLGERGEAYRDHCLIWKLFSQAKEPGTEEVAVSMNSAGILFRRLAIGGEDPYTGEAAPLSYYVVSNSAPRPVPGLLLLPREPKNYDPLLRAGDAVRFELRANPTVSRHKPGASSADGARTRAAYAVHDVLMEAKASYVRTLSNGTSRRTRSELEEQSEAMQKAATNWLVQRCAQWGLSIEPSQQEQLFVEGYTQHRLKRGSKASDICFSSVDFTGVAQVTDPELLRTALLEGVGRKRGFGCGLLLVRRLD